MLETYTGELLHPIEFDRAAVLPPDATSEAIGTLFFDAARWAHYLSTDEKATVQTVVAGAGSGILAASAISHMVKMRDKGADYTAFPWQITLFDNDVRAVETTERNLVPYEQEGVSINTIQADWNEPAGSPELLDLYGECSVFVTNPPFLTEDAITSIRPGYERAPKTALVDSTASEHGNGEYEALLPLAYSLVKKQIGSVIIGRHGAKSLSAYYMQQMLMTFCIDWRKYPQANITMASYHHGKTDPSSRSKSLGMFMIEPVGCVDAVRGFPVSCVSEEYVDRQTRWQVVPASKYNIDNHSWTSDNLPT